MLIDVSGTLTGTTNLRLSGCENNSNEGVKFKHNRKDWQSLLIDVSGQKL